MEVLSLMADRTPSPITWLAPVKSLHRAMPLHRVLVEEEVVAVGPWGHFLHRVLEEE
jgi:hypothetical protein